MAYQKINLLADLGRLGRGQKTKLDTRRLAKWALKYVKAGLEQTDIGRLEQMYRLEDPRA